MYCVLLCSIIIDEGFGLCCFSLVVLVMVW